MKLASMLCAAGLAALLSCPRMMAADPPAPAPASEAGKVYSPTDLDALRGAVGQTVSVEGTIVASGESKSKTVRYLNFTKNFRESIGLVFFASKGGEDFSVDRLASWVGKKIRVTGKVAEYQNSLQIEVQKWDQVQEVP